MASSNGTPFPPGPTTASPSGAVRRGGAPTVFRSGTGKQWYLFIDEYGLRGYVPFETTDLAAGEWTASTDYALPAGPRHGTVLPVTGAEYERLLRTYGQGLS